MKLKNNRCDKCKLLKRYNGYYCKHPKANNMRIYNLDIKHPDCPLEDEKEEK